MEVKAVHDFVALELEILNDAINTFDNVERGILSIDLKPITTMLNTINLKLDQIPYKLAKKFCKEAKFLHHVLTDYQHLVREIPELKNKTELLAEIRRLLEKCVEILQSFYKTYGYIPENRYVHNWYVEQRKPYKFLPYYYEKYYEEVYPDRRKRVGDYYDAVVYGETDLDGSKQFVPASFMGDNSEYLEWTTYLAYEDITKMKAMRSKTPLELSQEHDKAKMVADGIIKSARRMFQQ
jgi:hypothetical protein